MNPDKILKGSMGNAQKVEIPTYSRSSLKVVKLFLDSDLKMSFYNSTPPQGVVIRISVCVSLAELMHRMA